MTLYALRGKRPVLPQEGNCWIAPSASVIGDVHIAHAATIWFNAVLRGDNEPIILGAGSNIQDGCICHTDPGFPLTIGADVTIGHGAILHGCTIGAGSLIGMGAVVLNGAMIGEGCLIGAKALITEGKQIPAGSMVLGQPGKVVKTLDETAIESLRQAADIYKHKLAVYSGDGLTEL